MSLTENVFIPQIVYPVLLNKYTGLIRKLKNQKLFRVVFKAENVLIEPFDKKEKAEVALHRYAIKHNFDIQNIIQIYQHHLEFSVGNKTVKCDKQDFLIVQNHLWIEYNGSIAAKRINWHHLQLYELILPHITKTSKIDFFNGDCLDYRRANLVVTSSEEAPTTRSTKIKKIKVVPYEDTPEPEKN